MDILQQMTFSDFLEQKFLAWQSQQAKRKTLDEYADYLGVGRPVLSNWLTGKRNPSIQSARLLAQTLGPEVYDVLELPRPDPDLAFIEQHWDTLDPATRRSLREQAEKIALKNDAQRTSQKRRTRTVG